MTTKNFKTLYVCDTKYCADSIEWCPISPYKNCFVCGLYHLANSSKHLNSGKENDYQRIGGIIVYTVLNNKLETGHNIESPGVLDMKWSTKKINENIALAVANAVGEICVFYFENKKLKFVSKCVLKNESGDFLMLSLDWVKKDFLDLICSSDSKGNISLIKFYSDELTILKKWNAHSLEAWVVCFDSFSRNIIYSGGDDAYLKVWDCRSEESCNTYSSTKHTTGVTALNSNRYKEYNLVSGSYDEYVHFWDTRYMKNTIGTIRTNGGVWRIKYEPKERSRYLLAACIYGGFQIYDVSSFSVVSEYKNHESLAYGADWCFLDNVDLKYLLGSDDSALIATCSFYDHKLCVSSWNEFIKI